jgi:hypothetical protein
MRPFIFIVFSIFFYHTVLSQSNVLATDGQWIVKNLDNSIVNFYKGTDDYIYSKIIKSDNPVYLNQVIYKGKAKDAKGNLEGIFTTPKSKMNIKTIIYIDDENSIRFVGKKFFITKTYGARRLR